VTPHGCITASPETVRMFLLPSTSPKLRTLTAYAASAMGAKLSFAFTLVTYKAVNPQFSTFLINTCRSCFAPIKSTLALPFRVSWVAISQDIVLPLLSVLMVEALGTAPKSSLPFVLFHQTVSYLYHSKINLSTPFLDSAIFSLFTLSNKITKQLIFHIWP